MKFSINREELITPLQQVAGIVEKSQTMPILSTVLIDVTDSALNLLSTDNELQLSVNLQLLNITTAGRRCCDAKKLLDICKSLPSDSTIDFELDNEQLIVKSGKSRFLLVTLPAEDFPAFEQNQALYQLELDAGNLIELIKTTSFSMAVNDVRAYLNGMLLEINNKEIISVTTDGHRLSMNFTEIETSVEETQQLILPKKAVNELTRLFNEGEALDIQFSNNQIRVNSGAIKFCSKLIDHTYPNYKRVIPELSTNILNIDRTLLKDSLQRVSILTNKQLKGVRWVLDNNQLTIFSHNNSEQEEAKEELNVDYNFQGVEIAFNVSYLIDILNTLETNEVAIYFTDNNSSIVIRDAKDELSSLYVVMPMRL